jgi:type I restriction enzyme R subunit
MLDTGIDAPDVEVLLMARPTKSKVLYVQMKGRGTRKCPETGKEEFTLVDFVDIGRVEEVVTDQTPGINDIDEYDIVRRSAGSGARQGVQRYEHGGEEDDDQEENVEDTRPEQMIIADVPVWVEVSELIKPQDLKALTQQIEAQLPRAWEREAKRERLAQAIAAWRYFRGEVSVEPRYLEEMGFDLETLRDLYGEVTASFEEFVAVAEGRTSFETLRRRTTLQQFAEEHHLNEEQTQLLIMLTDFLQSNPRLSGSQLLRSQWLHSRGGARTIERLFGSLKQYMELGRLAVANGAVADPETG